MLNKYRYYNRNPYDLKLKDCVCRAISVATGLLYEAVNNLLDLTAADYGCDKLCVCCYKYLLEDVLCYRRTDCNFQKTVEELAEEFPNCTLIVRVDEHLTAVVSGTVLDIWDCSEEPVDCFWTITNR